jgi:hypothetical protein
LKKLFEYSFILTFIWFGFVAAISLMEAPVKFSAPSLTLPVGLDVGRIVFSTLNKVEIGFALLSIVSIVLVKPGRKIIIVLSLVLLILLIQTLWLLPALNSRALMVISGEVPPESNIHLFYIIIEMLKLSGLFLLGLLQIKYFGNSILRKV